MRMWMVDPKVLCQKHLVGEHGELHKFLPSFRKKFRVDRRVAPIVQIEVTSYKKRHDALAREMIRRGMVHASPLEDLPDFSYLPREHFRAKVDREESLRELVRRCAACAERIN